MDCQNFTDLSVYAKPINKCPLCQNTNIPPHYVVNKYSPPFKTDKCAVCGFIFMNPRFNDSTIRKFYERDYYSGKADYSYYDERIAEKHSQYVWIKRINKIRQYATSGNFLDVGCSFGGLLKIASGFFTPFGIDLSEYAGNHAKKIFGNNIHIGSLSDHHFNYDFFSVITMIELLEHEKDPVYAINECYKLLKNDGLLVIQTANMAALQAKLLKEKYAYYMPGHVSYFTKKSLIQLLKKTGFSNIKIFYPVEFGLLPKLLKSRNNFKSIIDYLKWIRITYYHFISKIRFGDFAVTSSMVVYAIK